MESAQDNTTQALRRDKEIARLRLLWERQPKNEEDFPFHGVLLSDAIVDCVNNFGLITPFNPDNLKPASYKLTVGNEYALDGKIIPLLDESGKNTITIPPFAVAIVKTRETINMPRFLIGRWNIQVSKAYEGLVWVGGPQVDPGYVGYLYCPIYNLRDKPVELTMGRPIAVIDFVTTTKIHPSSLKYKFPPDNVLFEEYKPETLISGIAKTYKQVIQNSEAAKKELEHIGSRIDNFVLITFSVIAVLFAAVTIFVSRVEQASLWNPPLFMVGLTSVFLSCWALMKAHDKKLTMVTAIQAIVVLLLLIVGFTYVWDTRTKPLQYQLNQLRQEVEGLRKQKQSPPALPTITVSPNISGPPVPSSQKKAQ